MNKNHRKCIIAFFLIASVLFAGCKKNVGAEEDNAAPVEAGDEKTSYLFGFSCIAKENPYYITLANSLKEALKEQGHSIIGLDQDTNLDSKTQIEQIHSMIEQGIDAIFLTPVDWQEITPALEALQEADVKIINIDAQVSNQKEIDAYIGSDNKGAGILCGQDLIKRFPKGGKVVILECPSMYSINERITGFEETIAQYPFEIVARADVKGDLTKARTATKKILKEQEDIVAIMCGNDPTAVGACVAAKESGRNDFVIYGIDGSPEIKKEICQPDSIVAATAAQSPIQMGRKAVDVALKLLNGEDYDEETYLDTYLITKENIDMYGADGWQ